MCSYLRAGATAFSTYGSVDSSLSFALPAVSRSAANGVRLQRPASTPRAIHIHLQATRGFDVLTLPARNAKRRESTAQLTVVHQWWWWRLAPRCVDPDVPRRPACCTRKGRRCSAQSVTVPAHPCAPLRTAVSSLWCWRRQTVCAGQAPTACTGVGWATRT